MDPEQIVHDVAERVREAIASAEARATEIVRAAEEDAERIRESAREEARRRVADAEDAISQLVGQAESLRDRLAGSAAAEVTPGPVTVPEPEPPLEPEPGPVRVPEPEPPLEPEPGPEPVPEPSPPAPPEPVPPAPPAEPVAGGASTEELIAQLKAGMERNPTPSATDSSAADKSVPRLVAMKMALEGASREEIDRHLAENYDVDHREKLLDDVLARAKA